MIDNVYHINIEKNVIDAADVDRIYHFGPRKSAALLRRFPESWSNMVRSSTGKSMVKKFYASGASFANWIANGGHMRDAKRPSSPQQIRVVNSTSPKTAREAFEEQIRLEKERGAI